MSHTVMLPIADAAKVLGVSAQTVRRRIHTGTLQAKQVYGPRGMAYRVILPEMAVAGQSDIPDHVAAALARSLTNLRAARARIEMLERERTDLQARVRHLQIELDTNRPDRVVETKGERVPGETLAHSA